MSSQQHADILLLQWQQRRDLPPEKRLPRQAPPQSFRTSVEVGS
jgi:hypothetical protein